MPVPTLTRITQFKQVGEKQFTARVTVDSVTVDVEYMDGSWKQVVRDGPRKHSFHRREVPVFVAEALQEKMPRELRMRACDRPKPKLNADDIINETGHIKVDVLATGGAA